MSLRSILIYNNDCGKINEYQYDISFCTTKTIQLNLSTNSFGPFDVYLDSTGTTALYSGLTRNELLSGVTVSIDC